MHYSTIEIIGHDAFLFIEGIAMNNAKDTHLNLLLIFNIHNSFIKLEVSSLLECKYNWGSRKSLRKAGHGGCE